MIGEERGGERRGRVARETAHEPTISQVPPGLETELHKVLSFSLLRSAKACL